MAPNGYSIECDKEIDCAVLCSHGLESVIVAPEVDRYALVNHFLIGHTVPQKGGSFTTAPTYFVVDTQLNTHQQGLNEQDWLRVLKSKGIGHVELRPTGYDPTR